MIVLLILLAIAFTCYVIYSDNRYGKLFEENKKLRKNIEEKNNNSSNPKMTVDMVKNPDYNQPLKQSSVPMNSKKVVNTQVKQEVQIVKEKPILKEKKSKAKLEIEAKEREKKNVVILITGAILIVLSAIVFLLSTWNSIPNILKTITLMFVGGVFFTASKIAKNNFNLPKASKTFFYIAMAYLPICLFSIWIFGLLGEYLAIFGGGSSLYLTIASLIVFVVYYLIYKYKSNNGMLYGSIIAQMLTTIFFVRIFTFEVGAMLVGLLVYNILLTIYNKYFEKEDIVFINIVNHILTFGISSISLLTILFISIFGEWLDIGFSTSFVFANLFSIANFVILYFERGRNKIYSYFANFFIVLSCFAIISSIFAEIPNVAKAIIALIYILCANIIQRKLKNVDYIKPSNILTMISLNIVYLFALFTTNGLIAGIVAFIQAAYSILIYALSGNKIKWITGILIPAYIIFGFVSIFAHFDLNYHVYVITFLALNVIAEIFKNYKKDLHVCSLIVTHIATLILFIITCVVKEFLAMPIYFFLLTVIYAITYLRNKEWFVFKYLAYIVGTATIATLFNLLKLDLRIICFAPMISTIIIGVLEMKFDSIRDSVSDVYLLVSQIFAFSLIGLVPDEINLITAIIFGLVIYCYNIYNKKYSVYNLVPLFTIFCITFNSIASTDFVTMIRLLLVCALTGYTVYKKELCFETLFSALFLFSAFGMVYGYVRYFILMIWSAINMAFIDNQKNKDIFKITLYISGFMLYRQAISELGVLNEYMSFLFMGIVVLYDLIFKNVVNKYVKETEFLDYVFYIIFSLATVSHFLSATDGLIYIIFLIGSIMFSYALGWGSVFFVSIASLGINIVYLTREFWLSIPWYIYLLVTGGVLIGFAIFNEYNERKNKTSIGKAIINFKKNIDKNKVIESVNAENNKED